MMSSQCFVLNVNGASIKNVGSDTQKANESTAREKIMSYEEKSVGSTAFFQCEACPFMALAEDDIKFHLFTVHPDLAKTNGLADNIQISCPGCTSTFDAEDTLRNHLRSHHKMGFKDVKKMIKSLVQIALKNAKLRKEKSCSDAGQSSQPIAQVADVKIPQVIEIVPDTVNANTDPLPKGVAFISVDELNKMSTPNFEKVDPKEIIQEASINIVYTNEVSTQYINVSDHSSSNVHTNTRMGSIPPDLISSITPRINCISDAATSSKINCIPEATSSLPRINCIPEAAEIPSHHDNTSIDSNIDSFNNQQIIKSRKSTKHTEAELKNIEEEKIQKKGFKCGVNNCEFRIKDESKLMYHRKCHKEKAFQCPECLILLNITETLHTHLWKVHDIDMDLPTCEICGYKTFKKYRLYSIHMKCHENKKSYTCDVCTKAFKNCNQLSKHKLIHGTSVSCPICQKDFNNKVQMKLHKAAVHDKLKPFKCGLCDYAAAKKSDVRLHMRSHTGEKPYSCDQCNYRFSDHNSLRRHKKQHTKENLYKCKHCSYTAIQSTHFTSHMISTHPDVNKDIHRCPYCQFKTVSKEKYITHLSNHTDKEGIQLLVDMIKEQKCSVPNWTIPSEKIETNATKDDEAEQNKESSPKAINEIPIEVYDCDSLSESMPQNYSKSYSQSTIDESQQTEFNQEMVTDLSKDDTTSDNSNSTLIDRCQFSSQHTLPMTYNGGQSNLRGYLNSAVTMGQDLLQNSNPCSLVSSHSPIVSNMSNNIMANFPIRLPQISVRNNITLRPADRISLPMNKVTGPIITPTQILPVPSSSNSPVSTSVESEGIPRKKPKISVKSNLILKGPDQENMFHSQQKMAFKRLEDNERFGLGSPVTFNNLITTQFMQLQTEPAPSESPNDIMTYQEPLIEDAASTPVDNEISTNSQMFTFNQPINVNQMTLLPPPQKIQTTDPSYIKIEAPIKQNTQSPSLERMCNANLLSSPAISREYKASPPLEDIHKNINEIKNEMKSDTYYSIALNNTATTVLDQFLMENLIGEQYPGHVDLSAVGLDQQNDVIEIDDNSDDNKLLPPRFDMNFPLESLYLMHNDFHFLENEVPSNNLITSEVSANEMSRMVVGEMPIANQRETDDDMDILNNDHSNSMQGRKDPMMNTPIRPTVNKINVKNIELMKN